ncbi:ribulose phosphate epimerase [Pasteurella multocida]|uniref:ribulose phosphate epimerase n=1 Tax=Pasteurella multocida TaxID=747 RepID=UPI000E7D6F6C|nr:ribulose phosphate epimerase [Pasteurella multocida]MDY0632385.1 ribulose phosphate epimerase [Pasteurella multocida]QDA13097.1 ribulose phosphate epimerase [Pasteurella multocida subsp. multocida]QDA15123.1 ribulose phosphate epimerase [Pasteurella multocida subsp. multocida]HAS03800.1 ribulose phosphate epimerase [Pasteurella multocida]HDR1419120.1 ribulose phosphate epimerase [Pasteurella multocida]
MNVDKKQLIQQLKTQPISVGILASDWLKFADTLTTLSRHHLRLLHFDIGDGQFSPFFTVGALAVKQFPSPWLKDVHLMVNDPFHVAKACADEGADIITLQVEQTDCLTETIGYLQDHYPDLLIGLTLCPDTEIDLLTPYLAQIDLIQILTLDPRTGVKAETDAVIKRIRRISNMLGEHRDQKLISVDGSMNLALASQLFPLGIDWVVSGSALFSQADVDATLSEWKTHLCR